jgi:S-DNA-T family DNA segregation ATPase FtsK/SpoIIIE
LDPIAASAAHRFHATHHTQRDLPLSIGLADFSRVELAGPEGPVRALARALILQAAVAHSPESLQIAVLAGQDELAQWEWVKWLPHSQSTRVSDGVGPARLIAPVFAELEDLLPEDLRERPRFSRDVDPPLTPHLLVVLDGGRVPPGNAIVTEEGVLGVTVLDLPSEWEELTDPNVLRANVGAARGAGPEAAPPLELVNVRLGPHLATADQLSIPEAEAAARRLAPLAQAGAVPTGEGEARTSAELTDLLSLGDVRDIDIRQTWRPRLQRDRLRVPIGLTTDGRHAVLDIKESAQQGMGPHGLIIGATGSGKSEVLRTLVLALALTHSSEQLNFVLVDFKGGATFAGMAGMPHVSAIITNLGEEISLVDRMQDALQGEMVRRQELLRAAGNFANVSDYEKARAADRPELEPLPALLIVADEFSELLSAKPEFVETFVAIGRLGRSLQMHLLLSSQRLEEGRLKGLDSHLSYRIGLRTFSAAESRTVIGVPDAYNLPPVPGVGFLKPDTTTMIQFRAAYVSGPPPARRRVVSGDPGAANRIGIEPFTAAPVAVRKQEAPVVIEVEAPREASNKSTFDIAVEKMAAAGGPPAHAVWLAPLEVPASLDQLMRDLGPDRELGWVSKAWRARGDLVVPLGTVDRPLEQRREDLVVSLEGAAGHLVVVGGPRSGKSTLARTLVTALALTHTPLEAQFYVLDFGGGSFTPMARLAHVAGVASRSEEESVRRVMAEVTMVLNQREAYFREQAIDSIETYRARRRRGAADDGYGDIFLVLDGLATLRSEFDALEPKLLDIAQRGLTFGVHLILTAGRWLDVRSNLKDMIGSRLELRLGDPGDSELDRKTAANVPKQMPGRGITPTKHHMLAALPRIDGSGDTADLADAVDAMVSKVNSAWHGPPGPKLRLLPELITMDAVRELAGEADRRLLLGIDEATMQPVGIDLAQESHLYLYGDSGSGKSSMLRAVAHEVARLYGPKGAKIFAVDYRRALLGDIPEEHKGGYLTTREQADSGMGELAEFLRSRLPGPDVTAEQLRNRSWWKGAEAFILVDDYDLVATSQGNPVAQIESLLPQAADVGLHLVLTRRAGGASRAAYDSVIRQLTDLGATGILLSGNPDEGQLIGKAKPARSVPGRAQLISRDRGREIAQLAFVPRAAE